MNRANIDKINELNNLIEASKDIKTIFLERIPYRRTATAYTSHNENFEYSENSNKRLISEIKIKPIKFTSTSVCLVGNSASKTDDICILDDTNKLIEKYFLKYINEKKDKIWKAIYEYMKKDIVKEKENILSELNKLKNDILSI